MSGFRVLEVAAWTFVPMAGGVLAEWGADVIKVEHPESGDPQRGLVSSGLLGGGVTINFPMEVPNRGKRSLGLDISTEPGHEVLLKLAAESDVFLTNFLGPVRTKLRIDVDDIRAVNPRIVYARGTSHGVRGPDADRGGYDNCTYWSRGGSALLNTPAEAPYPSNQPGGAYGDCLGGLTIAGGICAALLHRERTGEALTLDCSLLSMGTWATGFSIAGAAAFGLESMGSTSGGHENAPNPIVNTYRTADDRYISLVMLQADRFWPELVTAVGRADLVDDPRFGPGGPLALNKVDAIRELDDAFAKKTFEEWKEILNGVKGVWAPVQTLGEVMRDPQVVANGYLQEVEAADGSSFRLVTAPVQFNEQPSQPRRAPDHGEHTDDILRQLGYTDEAIIDLKVAGAVL